MYKKIFFSILVLITANLLGCSTSKEYHIDPAYSEEKMDASVLILPIQRNWFDQNVRHNFGSLSGQGETSFYNSLGPLLSDKLQSSVEMADPKQSFDDENFRQKKLDFGKDSVNVMLPTEQSTFNSANEQPEIVLILDQYYFLKEEQTTGNSSYAGHEEGITRTILYFETKYIYWNTEQKEAIAWGNTNSSVTLDKKTDKASSSDYHELLSKAVEKMSDRGPLL